MITGKKVKLTNIQKDEKRKAIDQVRHRDEMNIMGGYELIFPLEETPDNEPKIKVYQELLEASKEQYDYKNTGRRKNSPMDLSKIY